MLASNRRTSARGFPFRRPLIVSAAIGSKRRAVTAHVATKKERARLWPMITDLYGGFAEYQERTDREIPVVILSARPARVS